MQYHFKLYDDGDCIDEFDEELYDDVRRYGYQLNNGKLKWAGRIGK